MNQHDSLNDARKLAAQGHWDQAQKTCDRILRQAPADRDALALLATIHLNLRRPDEARKVCERLLRLDPRHSGALNILALIFLNHESNREEAVRYLTRAVEANDKDWQALANLGALYLDAPATRGEASKLLEKSLQLNPGNYSAYNGLGLLEQANGNLQSALVHFEKALGLAPDNSIVARNVAACKAALGSASVLGRIVALANADKLTEARSLCEEALGNDPDNSKILLALAGILVDQCEYAEARQHCARLVNLVPRDPRPHKLLAVMEIAVSGKGKSPKTLDHLRDAVALAPNDPALLEMLGTEYFLQKNMAEAEDCITRCLKVNSDNPAALNTMGQIYVNRKENGVACDYFERALALAPDNTAVIQNALLAARPAKRFSLALKACRLMMGVENPGSPAFTIYGFAKRYALWEVTDRLLPSILRQIEESPDTAVTNFLGANLALMATTEISDDQLFKLHRRIGAVMESERIAPPMDTHPNALTNRPKLRIGYLSADFRNHSVSKFFMNLLRNHDRDQFEVYLYSNVSLSNEDHVTRDYRKQADCFVSVFGMSDQAAAERIARDGINILVELGGYTRDTRLAVFAYRPAPIQISYLGYPGTTGMREVDHLITDPWIESDRLSELITETPLRMPESWICFGHMQEIQKDATAPFERTGRLTFGSLMNPYKFNRQTLDLWCEILRAVPDARLYFNHPEYEWTEAIQRISDEFANRGVGAERITFDSERHVSGIHLNYYRNIDLSLDTMPITGGTTTADALWMGVPIVTRVGEAFHERISYGIIMNAGLDLSDLTAFSNDEFVAKAIALANNPERLKFLRTAIPQALRGSILCDAPRFTAQLEEAFWRTWEARFPEHKREVLIDPAAPSPIVEKTKTVALKTVGGIDDLYGYVLRERGQWPDPEIPFLETCAELFPVYWDMADDPGVYAVRMASALANVGGQVVIAREKTEVANLVASSLEMSQISNARVETALWECKDAPDFVRLAGRQAVDEIERLLDTMDRIGAHPLVLANSGQSDGGLGALAADRFRNRGYHSLRLLPGFRLLFPLAENEQAGRNSAFFCHPRRIPQLESAGLLNLRSPPIERLPDANSKEWLRVVHACSGLSSLVKTWAEKSPSGEWGDVYITALNIVSEAYRKSLPPGQRTLLLKLALGMFPQIIRAEATVPRLLTGIRLMIDVDEVETALHWTRFLRDALAGQSGQVLSEPFVPPLQEWQSWVPPTDQACWCYSLAVALEERLRRPTSFHTPGESRAAWQELEGFPWFAAQARRMLALIASRQAELNRSH